MMTSTVKTKAVVIFLLLRFYNYVVDEPIHVLEQNINFAAFMNEIYSYPLYLIYTTFYCNSYHFTLK
jgi:hypothetical protein